MNGANIVESLQWRYATKKFDATKKINSTDWEALEQSLLLAPSSYGLQPWKFLIVQNPAIRKQLTPASWNQTQIEDCSHLVVMTTLKKVDEAYVNMFINRTAEVRGMPADGLKGYADMMIGDLVKGPRSQIIQHWAQRQSYIAMGMLMESAALMKIDTCPIEGIDPVKYDEILNLKNTPYATVAVVACGYRHADDKYAGAKKVRFNKQDVIQVV